MTDCEIRQLENERDFWRRKCRAIERKYAAVSGRSFLAIVSERAGRGWKGEVLYVEDPADAVRVSNYLLGLKQDIEASQTPGTGNGEQGTGNGQTDKRS